MRKVVTSDAERRLFHRVAIHNKGVLRHGEHSADIEVVDISLQGLRVLAPQHELDFIPLISRDPFIVEFSADQCSPLITAVIEQNYRNEIDDVSAKVGGVEIGCKIRHIDVESLANLRRQLALNSDRSDLTEQDLTHFIDRILSSSISS